MEYQTTSCIFGSRLLTIVSGVVPDRQVSALPEAPEIPTHLPRYLSFLYFDSNLFTILEPCPVHLGDTCTCPCSFLHDPFLGIPREANAKYFLGGSAEIFSDHLLHLLPAILRSVVEHFGKHLLKLWGKHCRLHRNCLSHFQVQSAIGRKNVEETLRVASMQSR